MGILISLALGTLGFLTSIIYFSTVMLPLIYGLPKSLYLSLRGEMRWMAPLHYLLAALGWLIGWAVIFFAIFQIFPGSQKYLFESGAFNFGSMLGTVVYFYRIGVSKDFNDDLRQYFFSFTEKYVITLSDDTQKELLLAACSQAMRNLFFYSIGGLVITFLALKFSNDFTYIFYLMISYIVLLILIIDIVGKLLGYFWLVCELAKARERIRFADVLANMTVLVLGGLTILVSYLSMSIVTPKHWNIFTFIGL
jgi:hypothetical protein